MNFENKYVKYKNKYIKLKKQIGGTNLTKDIIDDWNDSKQKKEQDKFIAKYINKIFPVSNIETIIKQSEKDFLSDEGSISNILKNVKKDDEIAKEIFNYILNNPILRFAYKDNSTYNQNKKIVKLKHRLNDIFYIHGIGGSDEINLLINEICDRTIQAYCQKQEERTLHLNLLKKQYEKMFKLYTNIMEQVNKEINKGNYVNFTLTDENDSNIKQMNKKIKKLLGYVTMPYFEFDDNEYINILFPVKKLFIKKPEEITEGFDVKTQFDAFNNLIKGDNSIVLYYILYGIDDKVSSTIKSVGYNKPFGFDDINKINNYTELLKFKQIITPLCLPCGSTELDKSIPEKQYTSVLYQMIKETYIPVVKRYNNNWGNFESAVSEFISFWNYNNCDDYCKEYKKYCNRLKINGNRCLCYKAQKEFRKGINWMISVQQGGICAARSALAGIIGETNGDIELFDIDEIVIMGYENNGKNIILNKKAEEKKGKAEEKKRKAEEKKRKAEEKKGKAEEKKKKAKGKSQIKKAKNEIEEAEKQIKEAENEIEEAEKEIEEATKKRFEEPIDAWNPLLSCGFCYEIFRKIARSKDRPFKTYIYPTTFDPIAKNGKTVEEAFEKLNYVYEFSFDFAPLILSYQHLNREITGSTSSGYLMSLEKFTI